MTTSPPERTPRSRFRAREFRSALKAFVRAGGDLETLARKTQIDREDLDRLLRGKFHWLSAGAAQALSNRIRVPVTVEYERLVFGTIPIEVVLPYVEEIVAEYGQQRAEGILGLAPRRIHGLRSQGSVTPEVAEKIVCAAEGPWALYDNPVLRRYWFASLPGDTLTMRSQKAGKARRRERREARRLVAA